MSITVVGSVGLDKLETPAGKRETILGGSACHFSFAASSFGGKIQLVGIVGDDFPKEHVVALESRGVSLEGLETVPGKTFRWHGKYENFGEAISLATELNVFENFVPKIPDALKSCDILFLGNIDPVLQGQVLDQMDDVKLTVMDTMNFWIDSKKEELMKLMGRVDVVIVNEQEATSLTGEIDSEAAGRKLLETGTSNVIVKRGENGAVLVSRDKVFSCSACKIDNVLDTTGAGDSFAGGFTGYLDECGKFDFDTMSEAVIHGCVLGSFNIEGFGPERTQQVTRTEVADRYNAICSFKN
jgi:sugar/nucleoside kinase (ribokinase family)